MKSKAIFLDRDGVINVDKNYVYKIEDFEFKEGIFDLLKKLQKLNYQLFIITNQSGIARGYYTKEDFQKLSLWMLNEFEKRGIFIKKLYYCPHLPDDKCECRKPKVGMLKSADKEFGVDIKNSWLIGDKESDIKAGENFGIKNTILISNESRKNSARYHVDTIFDIIQIINQ